MKIPRPFASILFTVMFVLAAAFSVSAQSDFAACRAGWDSRFAPNPVYAQGGFQGTYYDADGKLWFRGNPSTAGAVSANWEARWDGAEWKGAPVGGFTYGAFYDRAFLNGETYIATSVATNFQTGQPIAPFAKWNGTGYVRVGTGVNSGGLVFSATNYNGKLYLAGSFTTINGVTANNFAAFDGTNFTAVPGVDIFANSTIRAKPIVRNGKMYMVGEIKLPGETLSTNSLVEFDGTTWTRVGPVLPYAGSTSEMYVTFDTAGTPYVAAHSSGTLSLYKLQSGSWQTLDSATLSGGLFWGSGQVNLGDISFGPGGALYAVGNFKKLDGTTVVGGIIKYDGSVWTAGAGVGAEGVVNTAEYNEGKLYVGGNFETIDGKQFGAVAYTTDGINWERMVSSTALGLGDTANAVVKIGNDIYVGGSFQTAGDKIVNSIARWDGLKWNPLGSGIGMLSTGSRFPETSEPTIYKMAAIGTKLYVAGMFDTAGGVDTGPVAVYDTVTQTWSGVIPNDTFSGYVDSFNASGTKLYFGASSYKSGGSTISTGGFLSYDLSTSTFTTGPSLGGTVPKVIYIDGTDVYVGGGFNTGAGASANRIAKLNGGSWTPLGTGAGSGEVKEIFKFGSDIFISGSFTSVGGVTTTGLGRWNGTAWSAVGAGMAQSFATARFFSDGAKLYLVANSNFAGMTTYGKNGLGYWDSATNTIVATGGTVASNAVLYDSGVAYFALAGGMTVGCSIASSGFGTYIVQPFTNGGGDGNWDNSANWGSGAVPGATTITTIPGGKTVNITSSDATAKQLLVEANGTVNIDTGRTLTVERITINGSVTGGGTLEVTSCDESALYRPASATGYIQTALIRCVNDQGKYLFPVGTASGYAPVTFSNVTGTLNYYMKVKPVEGASSATGLPSTVIPRSWEVTDTCVLGLTAVCDQISTATLEFGYITADISGDENGYAMFSIDSGGTATQKTTAVNAEANRLTITGVNSFNAFTAGSAAITSITVQNNNDSGAGSLRDAVANVTSGGTITIPGTVTSPITLTTGQILIDKDITINGPGARNMTIDGGGTSRVFEVQTGKTANISGVKITGGNESCLDGGGIYSEGTLNLTDVQVSGNASAFSGGGVFSSGSLNIVRSTISGNTAGVSGGGVFAAGTFSIINSTIGGNTAVVSGGGLFVSSATGSGSLGNDTVSGNTAANGGGIFYGLAPVFAPAACYVSRPSVAVASLAMPTGVTVSSTIVAGNVATSLNSDIEGVFISSGYNFIGDHGTATGFTDGSSNDQVGDLMSGVKNAKLRTLGNYGGETDTYALLYTSPAIDKGTANSLTTDQRSGTYTRTWNKTDVANASDGTDVGAYEYRKGTIDVTNGNNGGNNSLRDAVSNAEPGDEITIPAGTSPINLTSGSIVIDKDLTITGPGARDLTIDGSGNTSGSVIVVNPNVIANVSGVTVTGGKGTDNGSGVLQGGGFLNNGVLTITDVQVKGNSATEGGGVYNGATSTFFANRSTIGGGNNATDGAGIYSAGYMEIINSTVSGNVATGTGGGIWLAGTASALVSNSTISANMATTTAGGYYYAPSSDVRLAQPMNVTGAVVRSTIIAGNTLQGAGFAPSAVNYPDVDGVFTTEGNNLIGIGDGGNFTDGVSDDMVGSTATPKDAGLDPLGSYGGGTDTMRLQSTSQAREKGKAFSLTVDQRGGVRNWYANTFTPTATFDGTDIGSYEYSFTTAAGVKIGGTVRDASGRGISRARVTVYDVETGMAAVLTTNQFGRYEIDDLEIGRLYVVTVATKASRTKLERTVMLYDSLTDVDFDVSRQ